MQRLCNDEIHQGLKGLHGWTFADNAIHRKIEFASYPDAIAGVARVGFEAEREGHHPDVAMSWKRVTFTLTTHDAGGLTPKDLTLAQAIDRLFPASS